jgi:hypothetical protein
MAFAATKTLVRRTKLGGAGQGAPFGPDWPGKLCGAKTKRSGLPCQAPAMKNGRCRFHGGKCTGPKTVAGKNAIRRAATKHGRYAGPDHPDLPGVGPQWPGAEHRVLLRAFRSAADDRDFWRRLRVNGWKGLARYTGVDRRRFRPLRLLSNEMDRYLRVGNLRAAAEIAVALLPYFHARVDASSVAA